MLNGSVVKSRYHKYYQLKSAPINLPSRIVKFKRPKWSSLQRLIFRNQKFNSFWAVRLKKWSKVPLYTSKFRYDVASKKKNLLNDYIVSSAPSVLKKIRHHQPWFKRNWQVKETNIQKLLYAKWYLKSPYGFQEEELNTEVADCVDAEKKKRKKKSRYSKVRKKSSLYFWGLKHVVPSRGAVKHSDAFQRRRLIRHELASMFDFSYKYNFNLQSYSRLDLMKEIYIKPLYTLDILLFYLRVYPSVASARRAIFCGFVLVNNKKVNENKKLNFGDMVSYTHTNAPNLGFSRNRFYSIGSKPLPFLEFDGSTGFFIINKEFKSLSTEDVMLVATKTFISRNVFSKY